VYALIGRISHNEVSVHGHESFEISARRSVRPSVIRNDYFWSAVQKVTKSLPRQKLESVVIFGTAIGFLTEYFLLTMNTLLTHRHIRPLLNQTLLVNRTASSWNEFEPNLQLSRIRMLFILQ
jgi:hypothetical protein